MRVLKVLRQFIVLSFVNPLELIRAHNTFSFEVRIKKIIEKEAEKEIPPTKNKNQSNKTFSENFQDF